MIFFISKFEEKNCRKVMLTNFFLQKKTRQIQRENQLRKTYFRFVKFDEALKAWLVLHGPLHDELCSIENLYLQGDQLTLPVFFWFLVWSDMSIVQCTCTLYSSVYWTSHFIQGTRKIRPCLTRHPVHQSWAHFFLEEPRRNSFQCRCTRRTGFYYTDSSWI